ncbi:hypothetical protein V3C99_000659, partial [Haemonchus contortus]
RNDGSTETNAEMCSGPASWDAMTYKRPKKLKVPCARVESDGEWFQIERVLETVCLVGSDKGWQSLVQWKPNWSKQIHTPSALKDFYGRATVLGCVVKNDVLRSRVRRRIEWNRKEFMSCNFRIRVEHPDGSVTSEILPYPDVKRRFPAALFEYMENRMPPPRVPEKDEPRPDGLLPVYNNINIPRCLYLNNSVIKKEPKDDAQATLDAQNTLKNDVENAAVAKQEASPGDLPKKDSIHRKSTGSVPLKEVNVRVRGGKKRRASRRFGKRSRLSQNRDIKFNNSADESSAFSEQEPFNKTAATPESELNDAQVKTVPPGISPACAKEFLQNVSKARTPASASSQRNVKSLDSSSKRHKGKQRRAASADDDIVMIQEITPNHKIRKSRFSFSNSRSARSISTPRSLRTRSSWKSSPGAKENCENVNALKKLLNSDTKSLHKSSSVKRPRRSSNDGKPFSCKRSTPLRPRNSLDHYFNCVDRRTREVLGNAVNQQNISAR